MTVAVNGVLWAGKVSGASLRTVEALRTVEGKVLLRMEARTQEHGVYRSAAASAVFSVNDFAVVIRDMIAALSDPLLKAALQAKLDATVGRSV